jgi:thiol:disulfide interchange protein DsbD
MILTAVLVWLKKQGEAIGWGFQLQSPWFVGVMAIVFLLLFLLMIEWLHFPNMTNKFIHRLSGINEFSTGFFAVLIASPCTGPFMGAAVGYAFMRNNAEIFAVFTALALGYALPYVLIELYPQTIGKLLPKPGKWMHKVKIVLSVPILLTALWLFGVLAIQLHALRTQKTMKNEIWQSYDAAQIETLANAGENVFIDFTAKWCLTCQFNDKVLLQSDNFQNFVQKQNVHLFKADLTENNEIYNSALSAYGRDGIPVYIYYHAGKYQILPVFFSIKDLQTTK